MRRDDSRPISRLMEQKYIRCENVGRRIPRDPRTFLDFSRRSFSTVSTISFLPTSISARYHVQSKLLNVPGVPRDTFHDFSTARDNLTKECFQQKSISSRLAIKQCNKKNFKKFFCFFCFSIIVKVTFSIIVNDLSL